MAIRTGDTLPAGNLTEFLDSEQPGCSLGPNNFQVADLVKGKRIAIFGVPGAFTVSAGVQASLASTRTSILPPAQRRMARKRA